MENLSFHSLSLVKAFKEYLSLLRETFEEEEKRISSESITLIKKGKRCMASGLYASKYFTYQKKEDILFERCSEKTNALEGFCPLHSKLNKQLSSIVHSLEKIDDFHYIIQAIHCKKTLAKRIKEWHHHKKLKIIVLYFFLMYEVAMREERNAVCYHFTKDEGHVKAISLRKNALEYIGKKLSIPHYSSFDIKNSCEIFDVILLYYKELTILSMDVSRKYIASCTFHRSQKHRRILCELLRYFLEESEEDIKEICYTSIQELTLFISSNEKNIDYVSPKLSVPKKEEHPSNISNVESSCLEEEDIVDSSEEEEHFIPMYEGPSRKKKLRNLQTDIDERTMWKEYNDETLRLITYILSVYDVLVQKNIRRLEKLEIIFSDPSFEKEKILKKKNLWGLTSIGVSGDELYDKHVKCLDGYLAEVKKNERLHSALKCVIASRLAAEYALIGPLDRYKKYAIEEILMLEESWKTFLGAPMDRDCALPKLMGLWAIEEKRIKGISDFFISLSMHDTELYFRKRECGKMDTGRLKEVMDISSSMKMEARKLGRYLCELSDLGEKFFKTFDILEKERVYFSLKD